MIVAALACVEGYCGLDPRLDRGLEALRRLCTEASGGPGLGDGRHELAGGDLYAVFSTYRTAPAQAKPFEAHRRWLDIQVVLRGRETLSWAPLERLTETVGYSAAEDIAYYSIAKCGSGAAMDLALEPGLFAVLFPHDGHRPGCHPAGGQEQEVRKLVLKVRVG